jgi:glycosyltransferase involved in cell wall biosynthesis
MNKENKVNVLEFCLSPDLGGLELFMINCFNYFKSKTNCKIILAPNTKLDNYIDDEVYHINRNKFLPIIPAIKLAKFIDKHDINIIHFHWTKDIATVVLAKLLSKNNPKIIQTRNMSMTRFKSDFYHKWLYKNIDTMHAVTHQVQAQLEKFIPDDIRPNVKMVYMGTKQIATNDKKIDILKEKYKLKDEFVVGIVGRIEEIKGQYLVIEAIKILENLNIKALIVGDTMNDKYLNELKQKTIDLNIEDKIIFTGFTKEVDNHMQLFDTNILATPKETFGLVVIEAMINKICMIATNKGGPLEIIDDCIDGLLFDRTSDDLALKIKSLYENEEYKNKLALNGYKKAKDMFDRDIQNNKLYNVIKDI